MNGENVYEFMHLDIYEDHSELHENGKVSVFEEGRQGAAAKARYALLGEKFSDGYLQKILERVKKNGFQGELDDDDRELINGLASGLTSNYGRGLIAVGVMQLAIKAICPEQSVRLHKASNQRNSFSWVEGVSMRSLDASYVTPFLRENNLLKLNADGAMMTRTLAENYPYSSLYKAKLQGPRDEWIELINRIEGQTIEPEVALEFLLSLLLNKSEEFVKQCQEALDVLAGIGEVGMPKAEKVIKAFLGRTSYPARAFEIAIHSFMQALIDLEYADVALEPLSQMRSANKKHGNVGDIELKDGKDILEAWDAKYQKLYLREELEELADKLETAPRVVSAGFVVDEQPDIRDDIKERIDEIEAEFDTEVKIMSLHDWIEYQIYLNHVDNRDDLAKAWIVALVESITLQRVGRAPIDEPCDIWVDDIKKVLRRYFK